MSNSTVNLRLQITGQQAAQFMKKMNAEQEQSQQKQKQNVNQIVQAHTRLNATVQQGGRYSQQQLRTGQSMVKTNQLLKQLLEQQHRQTSLMSQQLKRQERSYQMQTNQLRQQVAASDRLRANLQQAGRSVQAMGGGFGFSNAAAIAGSAAAGGMIFSNALQKPRDYAQLMTYITSTATGGQGLTAEQRLSKISTFEGFVKKAVRTGGGKREDVAAALNELIASGQYDESDVMPALLSSAKTAFAADADSVDAAKMTLAMKNFGVKNLGLAQDRAMRAGQVGSFEYRDMAKFLPSQMAMSKAFGYSGDDGLVKILALNQLAKTTAADSAEAGNNVVNLFQKLSSRELTDTLADKVTNLEGLPTKDIKNKKGKVVGQEFDWSAYSIKQREQGVYGVEAFVKLLDRQLQGNAEYTKLQKQAQNAATPEVRKNLLDDMSSIAMGSELGQFIADRQALLAAMAAVYNKDKGAELEKEIGSALGTVDADYNMVSQTEWAKDMAMNQEKLFAQSKAYDALSDTLGNVKESVVGWAQDNETLASAAYASGVALTAVAASAGIAALALRTGGAGGGGKIVKGAGSALGLGVAYGAGYGVGTVINNMAMKTEFGQKAGDRLGEGIAHVLAFFGNEEAKAAVEANAKYEHMIAEQEKQTQETAKQAAEVARQTVLLETLNQSILSIGDRPINLGGGSLLDAVSGSAKKESDRHAFIPYKSD